MDRLQYYLRLRGKVRGPYTVEQLRRLMSRGQFSRMHQISIDKIEWSPATDLSEVFSPQEAAAPAQEMAVESPYAVKTVQPFASDEQWFYASGQQKLGPVSRESLRQLLLSGEVTGSTLIWREGLPDWMPAESIFAEASAGRGNWLLAAKPLAIALVFLLLIGGGTAGTVYWLNDEIVVIDPPAPPELPPVVPTPAPPTPETSPPRPPVSKTDEILSVDLSDEKVNSTVNQAVGMVATYIDIDMRDGVHHEKVFGHGSGFVVNSKGYVLTNRHVVEKVYEYFRAPPDGRIEKLQDELLNTYMQIIDSTVQDPNENKRTKVEYAKRIGASCKQIASITPRCKIYFGTRGLLCEIPYVSQKFDMAVLRVDGLIDSPWFALRGENVAPKLTPVMSLGFPAVSQVAWSEKEGKQRQAVRSNMGLFGTADHRDAWKESAFELTPTPGEVSVTQKESGDVFCVLHTATIRSGNSGGPLVIRSGEHSAQVLGINTLTSADMSNTYVYVAFSVAQMRIELEEEAKVPDLVWR